jgi:hypothetical protein
MPQTCFLLPETSLNHIFNRSQLRWYNYKLFRQVENGNLGKWTKISVILQRTMLSNQYTIWRCFIREKSEETKKPKKLLLSVRNIYLFLFVYWMITKLNSISTIALFMLCIHSLYLLWHTLAQSYVYVRLKSKWGPSIIKNICGILIELTLSQLGVSLNLRSKI